MTIETFLLFAAIFIVIMTVLGIGAAILAYRNAQENMRDFERRFAERSDLPRRRFRL